MLNELYRKQINAAKKLFAWRGVIAFNVVTDDQAKELIDYFLINEANDQHPSSDVILLKMIQITAT